MLIKSGMHSVFTLLFIIVSVAVTVITDDSVVFMCGGKGEVFQNITKLGRKKADK
jgi:hypothetical protein